MSEKYNGWTNYETWSVSLIIDNDEGLHTFKNETMEEIWNNTDDTDTLEERTAEAEQAAADWLENWITDEEFSKVFGMQSYGTPTLGGQLLGAALSEVNWREIAEHYIADVDKE